MEHLLNNASWLEEELSSFADDAYFLFDCPGQIELFSHMPLITQLASIIQANDVRLVAVCCLDVSFIADPVKFLAGSIMTLSAMIQLEMPHINLLTKCDLVARNPPPQTSSTSSFSSARGSAVSSSFFSSSISGGGGGSSGDGSFESGEEESEAAANFGVHDVDVGVSTADDGDGWYGIVDRALGREPLEVLGELSDSLPAKFKGLNAAIANLLSDYNLVSFIPVNPTDQECLINVLTTIDMTLQYADEMEPRIPADDPEADEMPE
eukprot:GHVT01021027.1.p1 GENE.GHVT01021027.1~~GHVT01021027.1.p1  ORF type:complete len:266 (+),score=52.41 GHVT01021027.1:1565-2362(+)